MRFLRLAVALVFAGVLTGCFQTKTLIKLNADGSGTVEETVLMNSMFATTMMVSSGGFIDDGGVSAPFPDGPYDEAALEARAEKMGATLAGVETVKILFGAGYTATYAFDDINEIALYADPDELMPSDLGNGLFGGGFDEEWEEPEIYEIEDYEYNGVDPKKTPEAYAEPMEGDVIEDIELDFEADTPPPPPAPAADMEIGDGEIIDVPPPNGFEDDPAEPITFTYRDGRLTVRLPRPEPGDMGEPEMTAEELEELEGMTQSGEFRQMALFMGDMRFSLALEMPGEITETTATHVSGRTLTLYDMDLARAFEDEESFTAFARVMSMAEGEPDFSTEAMARLAAVPGLVFETQEEVTATFTAE